MASNEWLVRKLHEQDKKIEALSRGGTGVGYSSIAPGENLTVISEDGEVVLGAGGVEHVDGPTPATPSAPTLKLGFGTIEVTWDGAFAEGEDEDGVPLTAPVDFDVVEVHCSTDPEEEEWGEDTMRGQIKTREGGTVTVGGFDVDDEVFVCLIALAKTGKRSGPSATASLVIEGLDFAQLTNELDAATVTIDNAREVLLDGQNTLGEKLDAADTALSDLETTLGELDSTTLPALRSDLDAAEGRLDTAEGQITDAFGEIVDVRSDAAADASSKADAAKSAAVSYADGLKTQIDSTIDTARTELEGDITTAQARADAAFQSAADADSKASTAKNTADQAKADAAAAAGIANGKGKVLVQASAPGAADRNAQTLWIDTTGGANTPKRWTTGTTWVAVTDKAAVDAANAAATAQSKANEAKTAADAAQATATAAQTAASNAQSTATQALTSANTKNKVTRSTSRPPASYDGRVDDVWFTMSSTGSGGRVLFQEMWNGTTWVSVTIDSQVIAYLDAAKITTGYLNVASLIQAGAITVDKVLVGAGRNIIPWGQVLAGGSAEPHRNEDFYGSGTVSTAPADTAADSPPHLVHQRNTNDPGVMRRIMYFLPRKQQYGSLRGTDGFAVAGGKWRYSLTAYTPVPGLSVQLDVVAYNAQGSWAAATTSSAKPIGSAKTLVELEITLPSSAAYMVLYVRSDQPGDLHIVNPELTQMVGSTLIEGGAVSTDKLAANVLEVGNLKAGTAAIAEAVVQKIAASTASIQQADVKNLFVTGTSSLSDVVAERIAADTAKFIQLEVGNLVAGTGTMDTATIKKLFSDVVVASMAQAEQFIGENAILTGAVTAPKITASEELWAKIAEFVKIRAEHIEADAIDGMVITGATIRSAATGARTLMSASGFEAYNTANERTFFASASTGEVSMIGKLFTGKPGFSRVAIDPSLWASLPVYDGAGGIAGYASGAGIRVGVDASSSADLYHASLSNGTTSGVFRSSSGKSVVSVEDMPLSGGRSLSSVEIFGEVSEGKTYARFGDGIYATYNDKADSSYSSIFSLYKNSSRLETNSGDYSSSVNAGSGFARLSSNKNDNEFYSLVDASFSSIGLFTSYSPRGSTALVQIVNGTSTTNGYVNIAAENINPIRVDYLGTGPDWIVPFRKSGTDWGYVGSSGAMGVDEFGIQSAAGKSLRLQDSSGANIQVTTAGGEPLIISTTIGNKTYSGSANMYVSGGGGLGKIGSSLRYKTEIEDADDSSSVLDVQPRTWVDIGETNLWEKARDEQERIGEGPLPKDFSQVVEPRRYYGAIAEEVHDLGLTHLVGYDEYGRPDTLNYDRFAIALIPEVRKLRDRITELERLTNE